MRTLRQSAFDGEIHQWTVIEDGGAWIACSPFSWLGDKSFDNHAEAIAYADKEARK